MDNGFGATDTSTVLHTPKPRIQARRNVPGTTWHRTGQLHPRQVPSNRGAELLAERISLARYGGRSDRNAGTEYDLPADGNFSKTEVYTDLVRPRTRNCALRIGSTFAVAG